MTIKNPIKCGGVKAITEIFGGGDKTITLHKGDKYSYDGTLWTTVTNETSTLSMDVYMAIKPETTLEVTL